jgi:SAM-dependent methyltransferase
MNLALQRFSLVGRVLDVGGGHSPDYFTYFKRELGSSIETVDGSMTGIDFESDPLPLGNETVDTVILCNVLEHIYNHQFLLKEIRRLLTPGGQLIGFVPFWVGYHPDPNDYFRYTHEALLRMLADAGFVGVEISPLAVGPILANFNTIVLSLPRIARPFVYVWYAFLNSLFLRARPASGERNPLGYIFTATIPV